MVRTEQVEALEVVRRRWAVIVHDEVWQILECFGCLSNWATQTSRSP
jgi:hypothetical protein